MKTSMKTALLWNNGRKERQEDYPTPSVYATDVGQSFCLSSVIVPQEGSLLACFHLCLVSVLLTGPSLTEMKFCRNFSLSVYCARTKGFSNYMYLYRIHV